MPWVATGVVQIVLIAVMWLRLLGGKLGLPIDRDGPYILLRGLQAVWQTVATLTLLALKPFPHHAFAPT